MAGRERFFNAQPPAATWLGGLIVAAHVARWAAPEDVKIQFADALAVIPIRYEEGVSLANLAAIFGHVFLHANWIHLGFNMALFFAVSGAVARRLGAAGGQTWRFLALFFLSAAGSAACYIAINRGSGVGAVGASGAVCGLFAAYLMGARWDWRASLRDKWVLQTGFAFLAVNVGLAFVARMLGVLPIAWEAHLGGFVAGAVAFPFLAPRFAKADADV
ncbi:MAG: rhomboid family intramembrane serine protease [Hyphomonadaceae bacterium]